MTVADCPWCAPDEECAVCLGITAAAPPFTPEQFTRSVNASTRMAEAAITSTLADAYEKALRSVAADAARRFRVMATPLTAAIGDESAVAVDPQFLAPDPMELVPKAKLQEEIEKRTRQIREQVVAVTVGGLLTQAGIDFSVGGIFSQAILDRVGARVRDADLSTRDAVRTVINRAQDEGWSVPQTATAIKAHIEDLAPSTATQLARTDLIGTSNASATAAAKMVFAGTPVVKRWLATEDERTRPTHDAADGQTVPLNGSFTVGGAQMDYPGDPSGPDAEVCNCRCTLLFEEEGDLSLSASAWQSLVAAFDPAKHPRNPSGAHDRVESPDDGGKFAKKAGRAYAKAAGEGWDSPALAPVVEAWAQPQPGRAGGYTEQGVWAEDGALDDIAKAQGFAGLPGLVTDDELDAMEGRLVYRGVSDVDHAKQYVNGDYWAGLGTTGNGTYVTNDLAEAKEYAGDSGAVMRMRIRPEAKEWTHPDAKFQSEMDTDGRMNAITPGKGGFAKLPDGYWLKSDTGRVTAAHGYDMIVGEDDDRALVVNRTATVVADKYLDMNTGEWVSF